MTKTQAIQALTAELAAILAEDKQSGGIHPFSHVRAENTLRAALAVLEEGASHDDD